MISSTLFFSKFLPKIDVNQNGCWQWTAYKTPTGYGHFRIKNRVRIAHRVIFEYFHGDISPNLELDHLCRNPSCVNPTHLEAVTHKENMKRGGNSIKTHCPQGHPYTKENTYPGTKSGRHCKTCGTKANRIRNHSE